MLVTLRRRAEVLERFRQVVEELETDDDEGEVDM